MDRFSGEKKLKTKFVLLYHGTTIIDAEKLCSQGINPSLGKGEFGKGFYTVFDLAQAKDIARYYWNKEKSTDIEGDGVAVVEIQIPLAVWNSLLKNSLYDGSLGDSFDAPLPEPEDEGEFPEYAKKEARKENWGRMLIIGELKDKHAHYVQAAFGISAQALLRDVTLKTVFTDDETPEIPLASEKKAANKGVGSLKINKLAEFMQAASELDDASTRMSLVTSTVGMDGPKDPGEQEKLFTFLTGKPASKKTLADDLGNAIIVYVNNGLKKG